MVVTFDDKEQLEYVSNFVNMVSSIYDHSSVNTISTLATKLHEAYSNKQLTLELAEDPTDNHDNDQLYCLYNMCGVLNSIGADEVNGCAEIYNKLKKHYVKSDVPRFLEMLRDYHVPAEYCIGLFRDWCSGEGTAILSEDCMGIQDKYNIIMTPVWNWVCNNDASSDTELHEEVNNYKEAING